MGWIWPWSEIRRLKAEIKEIREVRDAVFERAKVWKDAWTDLNQSHTNLMKHRDELNVQIIKAHEARDLLLSQFNVTKDYLRDLQVRIYAAQKNDSRNAKGRFTRTVAND